METTQQTNNEYRNVPLTALQESATNPRRRFDEEHLKELAASFMVVAQYLIDRLPHTQVTVLAKRHKLDVEKAGQVPQQIIAKHVGTYDEEGLCRILLEISLLDSAYQRNGRPTKKSWSSLKLLSIVGNKLRLNA